MTPRNLCSIASAVLLGMAIPVSTIQAQSRICSGNNVVSGSYGVVSSRAGFFLLGATPPATTAITGTGPMIAVGVAPPGTTGAITWSQTSTGALVGGLASSNVFSTVSRLVADGAGNLYASATPTGSASTQIGDYTVGLDCSVVMTLNDGFSPTATGAPTYTAMLEGELMNAGSGFDRINLVQTNAGAGGSIVTLQRATQANGCTDSSLNGNYSVVGSGMYQSGATFTVPGTGITTSTGATTGNGGPSAIVHGVSSTLGTPFTLLGRFFADGSGNLVTDSAAIASTLNLGLTGNYAVNPDCTGTARLTDASGTSRDISFVLVEQSSQATLGPKQQLEFAFSDPGVFGSGYRQRRAVVCQRAAQRTATFSIRSGC